MRNLKMGKIKNCLFFRPVRERPVRRHLLHGVFLRDQISLEAGQLLHAVPTALLAGLARRLTKKIVIANVFPSKNKGFFRLVAISSVAQSLRT